MPLDTNLIWCKDHMVNFTWGKHPTLNDEFRQELPAVPLGYPHLILVLESPHVHEFSGSQENWGPVRGSSGNAIQNHLKAILETAPQVVQAKAARCQRLVIMNAIQHQCSEGMQPLVPEIRDENFVKLWQTKGGREDFQKRMGSIYRRGDVLILACTAGKGRPRRNESTLRGLVRDALGQIAPDLACYHPCLWNIRRRRLLPEDWK